MHDGDADLQRLLAAYLATRNVPCPKCRYNLRGVTAGACPECGQEIAITVGAADQSTMTWIIAMSLYGIAAALSGVFALAGTMEVVTKVGYDAMDVIATGASIVAFAFAVAGLVVLERRRERIWGASLLMQFVALLSVLIVPLAAFVVLMLGAIVFG